MHKPRDNLYVTEGFIIYNYMHNIKAVKTVYIVNQGSKPSNTQ